MAYGIGTFNAAFTTNLQYSLPLPELAQCLVLTHFFNINSNIVYRFKPIPFQRSISFKFINSMAYGIRMLHSQWISSNPYAEKNQVNSSC